MNPWMMDPRVANAETDAFEAERAERRGDLANARAKYHLAAEGFAAVAISVPKDHPNTRSDLAIAATASFARAGDFGSAVEFARRILAEDEALTRHGFQEISHLVQTYTTVDEVSVETSSAADRPPLEVVQEAVDLGAWERSPTLPTLEAFPASQSFPPPTPPTPASQTVGLPATSNGEVQLPGPPCSSASPTGRGAPTSSDGESQRVDLRPADTSQPTTTGLPANVSADTRTPGVPVTVFVR